MAHMSSISVSSGRLYSSVLCSRINSIKSLNLSPKGHVLFSGYPFRASRSLWRSMSRSYILAQAQGDDKGSTGEEDETFALVCFVFDCLIPCILRTSPGIRICITTSSLFPPFK